MTNTEEFVDLLHREMEQFIDEGYAELDQKEHKMRELGLIMYGDSSYYIQNPEEYEKDKKICELENEVERLEHRLSNCIEPKFKVGQEVWVLHKNLDDIVKTEIESICIEIEDGVIDVTYYDIDGIGFGDYDLFATEEEAKVKLEMLKNE